VKPPASADTQKKDQDRIYLPALDGLRFIAFLLVLLHHVPTPSQSGIMLTIKERGWVGVELFFVVSAFLFFDLFQAEHSRTGTINIAKFFGRRLLRLYPLMLGAPLLFMLIERGNYNIGAAWMEFWSLALFADNLIFLETFRRAIPYAAHLWTLSFEFQVYLVLPALFFLYLRLKTSGFLLFLLALSAVCLGLRLYAVTIQVSHPFIYFLPILRPESILVGLALAITPPNTRRSSKIGLLVLAIGTIVFVLAPNVQVVSPGQAILYPAAALACGALVWLSLNMRWITTALSSKPIVYLGKLSFGLYVFHVAVLDSIFLHLLPRLTGPLAGPWPKFLITLSLTLILTILAAAVSYRLFERPFLVLKDKLAVVLTRPI
jgi:peptidoglycan/LPS O-acetylase OafA/YrhL